ncbi:type II secretion system protein [Campylobacter blaseri]
MIELIFVIVILGILAAVAIPRLAATRDDAEVAKSLSNLGTAVSDITANYTAQGGFNSNTIATYTNVEGIDYSGSDQLTALDGNDPITVTLNYKVSKTKDCATISLIKNTENEISIFIGTPKLAALQEKISEENAELKKAKDKAVGGTDGYADDDAKKVAVEAAQTKVDEAKKALTDTLSKLTSYAPDGADSSCRSLLTASSFKDMAGKEYQLSGSRVKF